MSELRTHFMWRGLRAIWRAVGFSRPAASIAPNVVPDQSSEPSLASQLATELATVEIFHFSGATLPGDAVQAEFHVGEQLEPVQAALRRPLAGQLAVTAARNVRKGRKPAANRSRTASKSASVQPRRATVIKAKPVTKVAQKKRAPKRRHVWLSTQSRVIRTVAHSNVVPIHSAGRHGRSSARPASQKSAPRLRLAA